ncbi:MAG: cysteine synthase A [Nanoarchaeota archaeon]|nr:cysteine synthase A [Nanoarchaeota archaeon]
MRYENILKTIGNTPLVKITKMNQGTGNIYAKIEAFNPGGSVKDRIALNMIDDAEKKGLLKQGSTIIEPTSGNTGIGIAMVAAYRGYKTIFTMPESMSEERRKILKHFGAKIILTPAKDGMAGAVRIAEDLSKEHGYFMPQQFNNPANPEVHVKTTSQEIIGDMKGEKIDYFIAGVGTGGTVTGTGRVLKKRFPEIQIIAVEPMDSPVLSGGKPGPHKIQGIGAGFIPKIYDKSVVDEIVQVKNNDAMVFARLLAKKEGIFAGISSGAAMHVANSVSKRPEAEGKNIVVVLPDTAERYLSTELFE